jgi:iron complex outermembrane receptor protein
MKHLIIIAFCIILGSFRLSILQAQISQPKDSVFNLREVVIKDEFQKFSYMKTIIPEEIILKSPARDISDFLRTIPNVSAVRKGGSSMDPVVRGLRNSQLNVMLDGGIKIEGGCPNRMDPTTSRIEAEEIQNIEIIKGPYALKYGPNIGGIINLIPKIYTQFGDTFSIKTNLNLGYETNWNGYKTNINIAGGVKKFFFNVLGGFKKYGNYEDGNAKTVSSQFERYNYSLRLGYRPTKNQLLLLSFVNTFGENVFYPALTMDEKKDNTKILSLDYNIKNISPVLKSFDIKVYNSDVLHDMDNSFRPNYDTMHAATSVHAINRGYKAEAKFKIQNTQLIIGNDMERVLKDGDRTRVMGLIMMGVKMPPPYKTIIDKVWYNSIISNYGLYSEYKFKLLNIYFTASLRGDYNNANSDDTLKISNIFDKNNSEYFNLSYSLDIRKELNKNLSLGLSLGKGVRSPNAIERYIKFLPVGFDTYDYIGNPQLKPEKNYQTELSLNYNDDYNNKLNFSVFVSEIHDFISEKELSPTIAKPVTKGVSGVKQFYNVNLVHLYGYELSYEKLFFDKLGLRIIAAYTLGTNPESYNRYTKTIIKDALPEIPPFESTFSVNYRFFKNRIVPEISIRTIAEQNYVSKSFNEKITPSFVIANFGLVYNINDNIKLYSGVNNILNKAYYEHLNRRIIGSNIPLYEPGRTFFVNLSINF